MTVLPITIWGEPVLHRRAAEVDVFDDELRTLIADMFETNDAANGVGLAAPQVGVGKRLFIYKYENDDDAPAVRRRGQPGADPLQGLRCAAGPGRGRGRLPVLPGRAVPAQARRLGPGAGLRRRRQAGGIRGDGTGSPA